MPTAVFVGLTTVDLIHATDATVGANQKVLAQQQFFAAGGPAANAAVTAATLGLECYLVTALGTHPLADLARYDLQAHGVIVVDLATSPAGTVEPASPTTAPPPPLSLVRLATETSQRSVSSLNDSALAMRLPAELPTAVIELLAHADGALFDGYYPTLSIAAVTALSEHIPVVIDIGSYKECYRNLLRYATIAAASADARLPDFTDPAAGLLALGARCAVLTAGATKIRVVTAANEIAVMPPSVAAQDSLGAGDVFHGALLAGLLRDPIWPLPTVVDFAARLASHRTTVLGPRSWLTTPDLSTFAEELRP